MKKARYICLEGTEGVGKTTQTQKLVDHLRSKGYTVLHTKEPGTPHAPLTMLLRGVMLDKQYDDQLTLLARELISQSIRSIHLEKVIAPAMETHDFIVQDRGILSGLAYGTACGNDADWLVNMINKVVPNHLLINNNHVLYDNVIYLKGDIKAGLKKAQSCKQEFTAGDAMEAKGNSFLEKVGFNMNIMSQQFNTNIINVDGKNIDEVFTEMLRSLNLEN